MLQLKLYQIANDLSNIIHMINKFKENDVFVLNVIELLVQKNIKPA